MTMRVKDDDESEGGRGERRMTMRVKDDEENEG